MLDGVIAEVSQNDRAADETTAEDRTQRLAARAARRMARAHGCAGSACTHRNHRRDVYHAAMMIDALNLHGVPPPTKADYDDTVTFHSLTRQEAASFRGIR